MDCSSFYKHCADFIREIGPDRTASYDNPMDDENQLIVYFAKVKYAAFSFKDGSEQLTLYHRKKYIELIKYACDSFPGELINVIYSFILDAWNKRIKWMDTHQKCSHFGCVWSWWRIALPDPYVYSMVNTWKELHNPACVDLQEALDDCLDHPFLNVIPPELGDAQLHVDTIQLVPIAHVEPRAKRLSTNGKHINKKTFPAHRTIHQRICIHFK